MLHKFKASQIGSLKPGVHTDGGGLVIKVTDAGTRSYGFRYRQIDQFTRESKICYMGLGSVLDVSLEQAREKAAACRQMVQEGLDPRQQRANVAAKVKAKTQPVTVNQAALTFREAAADFIAFNTQRLKNAKAAAQWPSTFERYVYPLIGDKPVKDVNIDDMRAILEPIWFKVPETANRVRGRIENVLARSIVLKQRSADNPAAWRHNLEHVLGPQKRETNHHAALPYKDIPRLMKSLEAEATLSALALRLIILTACRTNEVIPLRWSEVDLEGQTFTIPKERAKTGKPHIVPLSPQALDVLRQASAHRLANPEANDLVFPGERLGQPLSNMACLMTIKRLGLKATVHGTARAGFRTWAGETTDYPREVVEAQLAHALGKVEAAYQRGNMVERRRALVTDWAGFICDPKAQAFPARERAKQNEPRSRNMQEIEKLRLAKGLPVSRPGRKPKSSQA